MLRGIILCSDHELGSGLERALLDSRLAGVVRTDQYPGAGELENVLRQHKPDVVFLGFESAERFQTIAEAVEVIAHGLPVVAVARTCDSGTLLTAIRAGAREVLSPPFEPSVLRQSMARISGLLERKTTSGPFTGRVYSFLPSKAGVGTSTVCLNTCLALARSGARVLLADFDLNCGMVGFMLRLQTQFSIVDAVEHALELDPDLWARLVHAEGKLDVLPTGRLNPGHRIDPHYLKPLMNFARRTYEIVAVDLSGMMEKYAIELLHESARIFVVCTPEVPSLHLAAQKVAYLRGLDLGPTSEEHVNWFLTREVRRVRS